MHVVKVLTIILTAMVTQSCKITMPSLIELLSKYEPYGEKSPSAYDFTRSKALKAQTGFKDTLIISDDPKSHHGMSMLQNMRGAGVPEESIIYFHEFAFTRFFGVGHNTGLKMFVSDEWKWLREKTRVAHLPFDPNAEREDPSMVASTNTLFVNTTGNMTRFHKGDRDLYNINHVAWNHPDDLRKDRMYKESYEYLLDRQNTGKAIVATSAMVTETGSIQPHSRVVQCGDIKESCYTIIPGQWTSDASARLAAMSFYLAQFWETPKEIVETLKVCAVDVGEPGVDREYGRGIANLLCPRVLAKEVEVVSAHLGETEENRMLTRGGALEGLWTAENTALQIYLPTALKETLSAEYQGTVKGTVSFKGNEVTMNVTTETTVNVVFLLPIEAKVEDTVQTEGRYTAENNRVSIQSNGQTPFEYTYEASKDSLHLVKTLSLNEALALLPDPLGSMVDMNTPDLFDDPIQIKMSFAKVTPPPVPQEVKATVTTNTVTLVWKEPKGEILGYRITRYTDETCTEISEVKETEGRTITFRNLKDNTDHYFTAEARNKAGWSEKSACLVVKTEREILPPGTPQEVRATTTTNAITLSWKEPKGEILGYRITRYTDETCTEISDVRETEESTTLFENLNDNTDYYFTAEAKNKAGWSEKSACLTIKTEKERIPGDFDDNDLVDFADFLLFIRAFGSVQGDAEFNERMDLVPDGMINFADFVVFIEHFNQNS